ncbi:VCBS domain-containing protein, partial [Pseudomonas chlororaphis]|uniref:VCBS domain-containing protein n=1 Tax=Pseudomonas chlororaphis TaxID=587753 RepID=UPI0031F53CA3
LKAGESHDEVFSVQVSDGLGGVDTQQVTVTVTGSNDAPVLSFAPGNDVGAVQEDSTLSVSGHSVRPTLTTMPRPPGASMARQLAPTVQSPWTAAASGPTPWPTAPMALPVPCNR